jgi:DNA (cytosine-5)-methyltransferase 1
MVTSLSLFSGCLGLDLGLEYAGIRTIAYVDKDPVCRQTIQLNRPDAVCFDDVFDPAVITYAQRRDVDIIVGGPPCQSFSTIGKRTFLKDDRGKAMLGFVRTIEQVRPKVFAMENVRGLMSAGNIVAQLVQRFTAAGYAVAYKLVNAADYGVPQLRQRFIMMGALHTSAPTMPKDTVVTRHRLLQDVISDLEKDPGVGASFSPAMQAVMARIPEGGNWRSLPSKLQNSAMGNANRDSGGLTSYYRRLSYTRPAPTLLTAPTQRATTLCHPRVTRPLSVAEYKRIQCFPDAWQLAGSITAQYRQLGNAVPVLLGRVIGAALLRKVLECGTNVRPKY